MCDKKVDLKVENNAIILLESTKVKRQGEEKEVG
jgi:hypothetical protein